MSSAPTSVSRECLAARQGAKWVAGVRPETLALVLKTFLTRSAYLGLTPRYVIALGGPNVIWGGGALWLSVGWMMIKETPEWGRHQRLIELGVTPLLTIAPYMALAREGDLVVAKLAFGEEVRLILDVPNGRLVKPEPDFG